MRLLIQVDGSIPVRALGMVDRVARRYPGNDKALLQIDMGRQVVSHYLPDFDYWNPAFLTDLERVLGAAEYDDE